MEGSYEHVNELGSSCIAERLAASQEGLSSMNEIILRTELLELSIKWKDKIIIDVGKLGSQDLNWM
jgi:hypothetical protein